MEIHNLSSITWSSALWYGANLTQKSQKLFEDNDIRVLSHPPFAWTNLIELVWAYLKKKVVNTVYNGLDEILDNVVEEWKKNTSNDVEQSY